MATHTKARPRGGRVLTRLGVLIVASLAGLGGSATAQDGTTGEWRVNGGDSGYTRYAPLDQISADTVDDLAIVWRREAVDASLRTRWPDLRYSNELRSTPLMVDGVLYASNGIGVVEAFDPATGETRRCQSGRRYWEDERGGALLHGSTTDRSGVKVADDHAVTAEDCAVPSANILFSTVHPTLASRCCASNPFARRLPPRIRLYRRNVPSTRACCR